MDDLLTRWLNEDTGLGFSLELDDGLSFDDKENIPPLPPSPLNPDLYWPSQQQPEPAGPPPPTPQYPPTEPKAVPMTPGEKTKAEQKRTGRPTRITERIKATRDHLFYTCKIHENFTWPGFTFFQLTPLAINIFHRGQPLYKYPLDAFVEILAYKDTREAKNLATPKKFGGTGQGYFRQFVETQDATILDLTYTRRQLDLVGYRTTIPTACDYPILMLHNWRQGNVYYDIYHMVMEMVCSGAPSKRDQVSHVIQEAIQFMGPELQKRVFKVDIFDGAQVGGFAVGDPFVVSYFGLFACACLGLPVQLINNTFYSYSITRTDIWALQYPPHTRGAM